MSRRLSRRGFFGLAGGAGAAVVVGAGVPWLAAPAEIGKSLKSRLPLPKPFLVPLPIPPVLTPRKDATRDYYEIAQQVATKEILPGVPTEIWGYNGGFPGPTIVSQSGRTTVVRHRNHLSVPTVVHLHGGHTPAASDGYPTDLVLPSSGMSMPQHAQMDGMAHSDKRAVITQGTRVYEFPLRQRAATLWYHDHRMDFSAPDVWRGLAGFHIVHDDEEMALPLPKGVRDIPLMIMDRAFAADGSLLYPALDPSALHTPGVAYPYTQGVQGDVILVNGAPWPVLDVDAVRYRFRLLNASNSRRYRVALDPPPPGGAGLVQIGSDGGLLERPLTHDAIEIAPGERFDVVIDFSRYRVGDRIRLVNRLGTGTTQHVMQFRVGGKSRDDSHVPDRLSRIETLSPSQAVTTRTFTLRSGESHGWVLNGHDYSPDRIEASPRLGDVEIWRFIADFHHSVHIHLVHFQVLSRNGYKPGPYDAGWKDTVDMHPAEEIAVIARFSDYKGRYVFHCHTLEHEDMAMMANFEVL